MNLNNRKVVVIGAGISGAVAARYLADLGAKVTVYEKRSFVGGNCYDFVDDHDILIHKFGPHLFHTNNVEVVNFLSRFTEWVDYKHRVKALLSDGRYVTLPVNKETAEIVGRDNLISTFFAPYTKKMWGMDISEVNPDILNRVPIRDDDNQFYFPNDSFQKLPSLGYTAMVVKMLEHQNISIELNFTYSKASQVDADLIFNSMPIDVYFDCRLGKLPYRSIKFHETTLDMPVVLPVATVNFTHNGPCTRVTEWKLLPNCPHTSKNEFCSVLTVEEPCDYLENNEERYYPINDKKGGNRALYNKYVALIPHNMFFIGRCGLYKYLNMDEAVASTLDIVRNAISQ